MGRKKTGRALYETLPSSEFCKKRLMWWNLENDEELPFLRSKIKHNYAELRGSICLLADSGHLSNEESIASIKKVFELEKLVYDNSATPDGWGAAKLQVDIAEMYARIGDIPSALEHLRRGAKAAKAFDNRPEERHFSSLLLGEITAKRMDFETSDTRPLAEIMRDKWLASSDFDNLRDTSEFNKIINDLG